MNKTKTKPAILLEHSDNKHAVQVATAKSGRHWKAFQYLNSLVIFVLYEKAGKVATSRAEMTGELYGVCSLTINIARNPPEITEKKGTTKETEDEALDIAELYQASAYPQYAAYLGALETAEFAKRLAKVSRTYAPKPLDKPSEDVARMLAGHPDPAIRSEGQKILDEKRATI